MIITDPNFLRQKCEPVKLEEVQELHNFLETELKRSSENGFPGIGLAAIQVGILKQFAIIRVPSSQGLLSFDLANAEIEKGYDPATFFDEGCLLLPLDCWLFVANTKLIIIKKNLCLIIVSSNSDILSKHDRKG
jgi:peptide deformylase